MQATDIPGCVDIVATNPILGPRYRGAIAALEDAWTRLLGREAFRSVVFEEIDGSDVRLLGSGTSVFATDDFARQIKTPPFFWIGPELARRFARGESPLLSDAEVRRDNSSGGLNLVVWECGLLPSHVDRFDMIHKTVWTFVEQHRGFLIKEWITQTPTVAALRAAISSGALQANPVDGSYVSPLDGDADAIFRQPHVLGLTRSLLERRAGSSVSFVFAYRAPRLGLRPSEQRLLLAAMGGGTDQEIATELAISLSTVKKTWRSIHERASPHVPGLVPLIPTIGVDRTVRGKEKKQQVLMYVREHPEELRPANRKARATTSEPQRRSIAATYWSKSVRRS